MVDRLRSLIEVGGPVRELFKRSALLRRWLRRYRLRFQRPEASRLGATSRQAGPDAPRVLMATSAGGFLDGLTIDGVVGAALEERGAQVEALLCDRALPACQEATLRRAEGARRLVEQGQCDTVCPGCFEAGAATYGTLGIRLNRYGDLLTPEDEACARAFAIEADLSGDPSELCFDDVPVGEHAVAGALRFFGRANFDGEPDAEPVVRRFLEGAVRTSLAVGNLLNARPFDVVVVHHGIYVPQGIVAEVARRRGVRVVAWSPSYRSRTVVFSHDTTYHHTMLTEPTESWEQMAWGDSQREELTAYLRGRWTGVGDWLGHYASGAVLDDGYLEQEVGVDFSRPVIGLLTNVMWDAQLLYRGNAYPTMLAWCVDTVRWFAEHPELQLLIRVHPAEVRGYMPSRQPIVAELLRVFGTLPDNVFVIPPESRASTYAAMLRCDAAIVYGTKTGVELAAMGLPIIVAGEAWVRNKGITRDASSPEQYRRILDELPFGHRLGREQLERAQRYAYHYFFRRMVPLDVLSAVSSAESTVGIGASSRAELVAGASRGLDVVCDGILHGAPFVYPAELEVVMSDHRPV